MAKIKTYANDNTINANDKLIGTDFNDSDKTKNYLISELKNYILNGLDIRPYKVFTALLTQIGEDNIIPITSGTLTIGVTYWITENVGNPDFTIVGAPNNEVGTYFIATGTNPNWGTGGAELKFNTGAPVATVLENTIGNIWFTYVSIGSYEIESDGLFIQDKAYFSGASSNYGSDSVTLNFNYQNDSFITLLTFDVGTQQSLDDALYLSPIEIRVYN